MTQRIVQFAKSPIGVRVLPFLLFAIITSTQGVFGEGFRYWGYFIRSVLGAGLIWAVWSAVSEMRWRWSWEALVVGIGVFVMWVGIDGFYPKFMTSGQPWNPHIWYGQDSAMAWFFIITRILGSSLVVPFLEEVFFRSFVYRYIHKADFMSIPLGQFLWMPFLVTSLVFGFEHREWLAGILCGFAYQGLVIYKKRLGDAITAHAITNFLLGCYIVWKGAWVFW